MKFLIMTLLLTPILAIPKGSRNQLPQVAIDEPQFGTSHRKDNIDERGPYIGGDMVMSEDQKFQMIFAKSGIVGQQYRWPKGQIPYTIDPNFSSSDKQVILSAIKEIENKTCIQFMPRTSQTTYASIVSGAPNSGCYSSVGMQPANSQPQKVNIQPGNPGCVFLGIVAHELIHTIGYYHEQSRTDRDDFVTINWSNIQSGQSHNFDKYSAAMVNPYNVSYDYGSIMHYSAYAFAADGSKTTIQPKQNVPLSTLGQRNGLSVKDAQKINAMYKEICP